MSSLLNPYRFAAGGGDPYWDQVVLLLHADAFPIVDSSNSPTTITAGTDSVYSTSSPKFGAGNLDFNANSRFLNTETDAKFTMGTSDWTWEAWIKGPLRSANSRWLFMSPFIRLRTNIGGTTSLLYYSLNGSNFYSIANIPISSGVWSFTSISRTVVGSDSVFKVFIDGVQFGSDITVAGTDHTGVGGLIFGGGSGNQNTSYGAIDDCRISKVYRDGTIVPTERFPDS